MNFIYKFFFKRILDIVVSFIIILLLLPLLIVVVIWIVIDSKGPIFFTQNRIGKNLESFVILKFRTMTNKEHLVGIKPIIGKASGVTKSGYFLRRLKIDELPQLFNVLKGDMSLIGPRPSIKKHLDNMTEEEKLRYSVFPGLTGLAQVSGNIHLPWKVRYLHDLEYVNHISFINDVRILLRTFVLIVVGEDKFKDRPLKMYKK